MLGNRTGTIENSKYQVQRKAPRGKPRLYLSVRSKATLLGESRGQSPSKNLRLAANLQR